MPILHITLIEGRSQAALEDMYREVTEAVHRTLDAPKESIRILVHEVPAGHVCVGGVPKSAPRD
jgi:4-oxalocrotonate tautomerase